MQSTKMSKLASRDSQLLLSNQKCAKCLLETYVSRSLSLSLNEGCRTHQINKRASSDTSTHRLRKEGLLKTRECPECTAQLLLARSKTLKASNRAKTHKSFFRRFLQLFSKKKTEPKVKDEGGPETDSSHKGSPGHSETPREKNSLRGIFISSQNDVNIGSSQKDSSFVPGVVEELSVSVDSDNKYFEKVSEELELIVKEIQFSPEEDCPPVPSYACLDDTSDDNTTERIISLLKQHGDIINQRISKNKSVQDFLQSLSYSSFQHLADRYIAQIPSPLPQTTDASAELVRLAFTLDFTAKVAGLCSQTVGRIMGFGYQYLQDSFTQMCAAHRQVPEDLKDQTTSDTD